VTQIPAGDPSHLRAVAEQHSSELSWALPVLVRESSAVGMLLDGMHGRYGQRADRNCPCHDEETLVHDNSQPDAQTKQKRDARGANVFAIFFNRFHNVSF
jgi:hypothetical protein